MIGSLVFVLAFFFYNTQKVKTNNRLIEHTQEVLLKSSDLLLEVTNIETNVRGYVMTDDEDFIANYNQDILSINTLFAILKEDTKDNVSQQIRIDSMIETSIVRGNELEQVIKNNRENKLTDSAKIAFVESEKIMSNKIKNRIEDFNNNEFNLLKERKIESNKSNANSLILFLTLLFFIIISLFLVSIIIKNQKDKNEELIAFTNEISGYKDALNESSLVTITDKNGIILFANDNFCKSSKYTREELIGKDYAIVNSGFHSKEFMRELWDTITAGKIWRGEFKNKTKYGDMYWVDTTIVPFFDKQGEIYQFVAIRIDITKQKLMAQYSRSLIEASLDPLLTINREGKMTDMNEATLKITGVEREKLIGSDFADYFTDPQKAREVYQEVFAKGFVKNYPLSMKDHKSTDVLFNGSVYKDEEGNMLGAVVVARDITEQKRSEKELIEAKIFAELAKNIAEEEKSKAENAAKSKQQFLSNMSHEIRTPMNAIIGFTKVVLKTELSAKQREYLTAIKMSGDALIVLINDILDLAKVDAGKMTFEKTPFKLLLSISAMLHLFETKIQEKNLDLIKIYDPRIPDVLVGDPVRLHQIIMNLLSNAVKFTSKGQITVTVSLFNEDEKQVTIEFAVKDTGIGIVEDQMDKIFENFQQASSDTARLFGGTGLGLAIVKQLVESQGGHIQVKSTLNEGTTFSFRLNFQKTDAMAEEQTEIIEMDEDIKNIKVLVVEDMALNQLLMKTVLDEFGFDRDIAENGKKAIEKLLHKDIYGGIKAYDIILMDLQMPEMNGFEATEYIRHTLKSKIPIIALTADVTTVDVAKCKTVGMNDYIAKPVDERILYSKIMNLVKKTVLNNAGKEKEMNQIAKQRYTNLEYLMRRTRANPTLMSEMILAYLEQTPPLINAMRQSFQEQDWHVLHNAVHKMIPSFSIMGMSVDFESMARKVMEYARTQEQTDSMGQIVSQLENACVQACDELREELKSIKNKKDEK
jgi:PAS domain S-box-containing protein